MQSKLYKGSTSTKTFTLKLKATYIIIAFIILISNSNAQQIYVTKSFDITGQGTKGILVKAETDDNEGFYKLHYISKTTDNKLQCNMYTYDYDFNFIDVKSTKEDIDTSNIKLKSIGYKGEEYQLKALNISKIKEEIIFSQTISTQKFDWKRYIYKSDLISENKLKSPYKQKDYNYLNHIQNASDSSFFILLNNKKKQLIFKIIQLNKQGKVIASKEFEADSPIATATITPLFNSTSSDIFLKEATGVSVMLTTKKSALIISTFDLNLNIQTTKVSMNDADSTISLSKYESFIQSQIQQCQQLPNHDIIIYSITPANTKTQEPAMHLTCKINGKTNQLHIWSTYTITPAKTNSLKTKQYIINDSVATYQLLFEYDETQNCIQRSQAIPRIQQLTNDNNDVLDPGAPEIILEPFIPFVYNAKSKKIIFFGNDHPCKSFIYSSVGID